MKGKGSLNLSKPHEECSYGTYRSEFNESSFSKEVCQNESNEPTWKCRYVVILYGYLIGSSMAIHRIVMSVSIVAMVNNSAINQATVISDSCPDLITNLTVEETGHGRNTEGEFIWSPTIHGYILGSFYLGFIISLVPVGRLVERYGCKWFLFGSSLSTAIFTMIIPPFSRFGASAVIVTQMLRGFAQGILVPSLSILVSNWCPKTERGFSYSIIMSSHSFGTILGDIFIGYMTESAGGWPVGFYSVGISGIALSVCIWIFLAESPNEHPRISKAELNFILNQQECALTRKRPKLPWREILTSVPVYALCFAMFGRYWISAQFWIVHSTFLGTILHYSIGQNGLLSAAPFLLSFVAAICASWLSLYVQKKNIVSVDVLRKFWVFISSTAYSVFLFGMYVAGCNRNLSAIFSVLSYGISGFGFSGCLIVSADMSPTFSGTLQSISSVVGFTAGILFPVTVGYLTEGNQTLEQWNYVFFLSIGIVMSSAVIFVIFGSAKIQPWNFVEQNDAKQLEVNKKDDVTKF